MCDGKQELCCGCQLSHAASACHTHALAAGARRMCWVRRQMPGTWAICTRVFDPYSISDATASQAERTTMACDSELVAVAVTSHRPFDDGLALPSPDSFDDTLAGCSVPILSTVLSLLLVFVVWNHFSAPCRKDRPFFFSVQSISFASGYKRGICGLILRFPMPRCWTRNWTLNCKPPSASKGDQVMERDKTSGST